jgi:LPXTG-site transpeptidase (sortase) family protein
MSKSLTALVLVLAVCLLLAGVVHAASTIVVTVDDGGGGDVGEYSALALNSSGNAVIAYFDDTDNQLILAVCNDAACTAPTTTVVATDVGSQGSFTSLQLDSNGFPMISYYEFAPNEDLHFVHCDDAFCNSLSNLRIDAANQVGSYTSLVLNSSGNGVISYYESSNGGNLKIAICNDVVCTAPTVNTVDGSADDSGLFTSLQLDGSGFPVIAYYNANADSVMLAHCVDALCAGAANIHTVDNSSHVGFDGISLELDASGFPVLSYYDVTNTRLKLAHCTDVDCANPPTINVVDDSANVGQYSSLELDGSLPVISYYDDTNGDLKVAFCSDPNCAAADIQVVDSSGDVGVDTSLVVGSAYISYHDASNQDLKFAFVPSPILAPAQDDEQRPSALPETGFAPDLAPLHSTSRPEYAATEMDLVIPSLGIHTRVVGVPFVDSQWDVSWLGSQVGYLEGTAWPTWVGNSVLTGHVWDADNTPGIFAGLGSLAYGDHIEIHADGRVYVYEVLSSRLVSPKNLSVLAADDGYAWLTLLTCEGFDPGDNEYSYRRAVSAVLVEVK